MRSDVLMGIGTRMETTTSSNSSGRTRRFFSVALQHALQACSVYLGIGIVILLAGESIFRGITPTMTWLGASTPAALITVVLLALFVFSLEIVMPFAGATAMAATLFCLLSFASREKVAKLGVPATPTDLLLSHQYLDVSYIMWGSYAYLFMAAGVVLILFALWWLHRKSSQAQQVRNWIPIFFRAASGLLIFCLVAFPDYNYYTARYRQSRVAEALDHWGIHNLNFDSLSNANTNGQLIAFLMNARSAVIRPPEGYSPQRVQALLGNAQESLPVTGSRPDVVVIMSEAFWDPSRLPGMRYSNALLDAAQTTQRGWMFSPVFGGYTANTEFEALSSLSNGLLPVGSIPYVQYVTRPTRSLASDFVAAGYDATAMHPFDGSFWNRRTVYQRFGFQAFDDRNSFVHRDMTGPFINDEALAHEINDRLSRGAGPHFVFAVSLEGHAPYTGGMYRYADRVTVHDEYSKLTDDAKDQLSTYASGVRDAVSGFNQVVNHARQSGRPTIVVMFGDHLPALGDNYLLYRQSGYLEADSPSLWTNRDQEHMHEVPLLVWTNTGTKLEGLDTVFSPIFLAYRIKDMAGIPAGPVDGLLRRTASQWPVLSQVYSKSASGQVVQGMPKNEAVGNYAIVAYDLLFGAEHARSEVAPDILSPPSR